MLETSGKLPGSLVNSVCLSFNSLLMSDYQVLENTSKCTTSTCLSPNIFHIASSKAPVSEAGVIPIRKSFGIFNNSLVKSTELFINFSDCELL